MGNAHIGQRRPTRDLDKGDRLETHSLQRRPTRDLDKGDRLETHSFTTDTSGKAKRHLHLLHDNASVAPWPNSRVPRGCTADLAYTRRQVRVALYPVNEKRNTTALLLEFIRTLRLPTLVLGDGIEEAARKTRTQIGAFRALTYTLVDPYATCRRTVADIADVRSGEPIQCKNRFRYNARR